MLLWLLEVKYVSDYWGKENECFDKRVQFCLKDF